MRDEKGRARILLVEDSPTQAAEVEGTLSDAGFDVDVAGDGLEGLNKARTGTYDLVLSDIMMPGLWGHELCRQIKADRRTRDLPVILLTGLNEPTDIIEGLESGADNYITKPWVAEDLVRRVSGVLEKRSLAETRGTDAPVDIWFMGKPFAITRDRRQVLEYFASTFEDYVQSKQREWESRTAEAMAREKHETAAALARTGTELMASLDSRETASRFCQLVIEILACDRSHTFLRDPETGDYVPVAGHGATPFEWQSMRGLRLAPATVTGLLERMEHGNVVVVRNDREESGLAATALPCLPDAAVNLYTPLRRGTEMIGFQVAIYRDPEADWTPRQEHLARGMAEIASLALENSRLHEELGRANRLKTDFIHTMSHELRTPLSIILGYCQLLLDETFGAMTREQMEGLQRVEHNATELAGLINSILDLSRLERGRFPVIPGVIEADEIVHTVEYEIGRSVRLSDVEFHLQVQPGLPRLYTDRMRLKTILRNLVDNAFKFTEQGSVTVTVAAPDGAVEFTVADTGIGIDPDTLPEIFDCFRQGHDPLTRCYGGVGLGLYVVKRLVDDLGGRIEVQSRSGEGSTFRVRLPEEATLPASECGSCARAYARVA